MQPMMRRMMNSMMEIEQTEAPDCTYAEVQGFMVPKMFDPEDKEKYATFVAQRPWCVPGYVSKSPKVGATMDGSAHSFQGYGRKVSADGGDPTFCWSL